MSINRIELQGTITRAQDYTTLKHNEDHKGAVDQNNFQQQFHKVVEHKLDQVHKGENASNEGKRHDAKEKGKGQYSGDGGKNRNRSSETAVDDGKIAIKNMNRFDVKI